jgi:toxin FitB
VRGIVLDTNVVSDPVRPRPSPAVTAWFERQDTGRLYLTTTVICEIADGIERMAAGHKRHRLEAWLDHLIEVDFRGRVLQLDVAAARFYGKLAAAAWARGRPPRTSDTQIAAVAARDGLAVATRDIGDFAAFGVPLVDPWSEE